MSDRLYGLRPTPYLPVEVQNIGNIHRLAGILLQGENQNIMLVLPSGDDLFADDTFIYKPTEREWAAIIAASDDPQYYDEIGKVWLRKAQKGVSGKVQQIIWARDNFECQYCHRKMGNVQLTVDHFLPLELGGLNDDSNYLSACRMCNKEKGRMHPRDWCRIKHIDYDELCYYLERGHNET